jgi:aryl-alcohol dehydrogenase-like predicted oxidoreductase
VSEVTFGAHGIGRPDLMRAAVDAGINTFCVSGNYLDGLEEKALGEAMSALGARREKVVIVTGSTFHGGTSTQRVLDEFDASLQRLGTDHIHVYLIGEVRTPDDLRVEAVYEAFDRAKQAGKIGHLGLSSHAGVTNPDVASVAVSMSNFDTIRQYSAAAGTTLSSAEVSMLRRYADDTPCTSPATAAKRRPCSAIKPCPADALLGSVKTAQARATTRVPSDVRSVQNSWRPIASSDFERSE